MYVTYERKCFRVTKDTSSKVESLYNPQEKVDTRMFLHEKHAEEESTAIIIASQDTDVFIMCLSFSREFAALRVAPKPDVMMCRRLLLPSVKIRASHFLDCIRSQAFGGKGKISAFKLVQKKTKYQDAFTQLGKEWSVPGDLFNMLQEFTCKLYAARCPNATVNKPRYQLFCAKKGEVESGQLPPCEDCLLVHSLGWSVAPCSWRVS